MVRFLVALVVAVALPAAAAEKPVLSVLYFDNDTGKGDYDVLRKGLADMIITDLVAWDGVAVVEREKLESVMAELKLQRTRSFDPTTISRLGKFLGAQLILAGSIHAAEAELRIDARVIQAASARVVVSATVRGPRDKVFDLEQSLVDQLGAGIDLRVANVGARGRVKAPDLDSLLGYSRAIDLSDRGKVEEAKVAIQQVVSRAPTFLMARDKKDQILKQLDALRLRRADLVMASTLALAEQSKKALDDTRPFGKLAPAAALERLGWRLVRARLLARLLRQSLTAYEDRPRVVQRGKEAEAHKLMIAWLDNQHRLVEEQDLYAQVHRVEWASARLPAEVENQVAEARLGPLRTDEAFRELIEFVMSGRLVDGTESYWVAPAPAWLLPDELTALSRRFTARLDAAYRAAAVAEPARVKRTREVVEQLAEQRAQMLEQLGHHDEAAAVYQRVLDAFPTSESAERLEKGLRELVEPGSDSPRAARDAWARAMKSGCQDAGDVRKSGSTVISDRVLREGTAGLVSVAAELVQSCRPTPTSRDAIADVFKELAMKAAGFDECDAFRAWMQQFVQLGGSVRELKEVGIKRHWCPLNEVMAQQA